MYRCILLALLLFSFSLPSLGEVAPLATGESIDDFFGRISYGVTGRTCDEASYDEYLGFRCGMKGYYYADDNTYQNRSGGSFFQNVTDSIVFNNAAESVHSMNQCQVSFYDNYFKNDEVRGDLQTRALGSFNEIRSEVSKRKKRLVDINTPSVLERLSLPCATSTECAGMSLSLENRTEEALERDSRLSELLAAVPMGNRPQMRNYLLSVVDENIDETTFRRGYDQVMRELEAEAKTSFNKIHKYYRQDSDNQHHFEIDSDLRRSLINNGIVGNIIAEHELETFASTTNFMCRIDRRNEGMWVGAGTEIVLSLAAAFVTRGASAEITPYVLASMRTGSILRRIASTQKLTEGAAAGLSRSTTAKLLLYGAAHTVEAMMTYKDVSENCFGPEYLTSRSAETCSAESQTYNVIAEASMAACAVSSTLGIALPVSMVALNRVGVRAVTQTTPEIAEANPVSEIIVRAPRRAVSFGLKIPKLAEDKIANTATTINRVGFGRVVNQKEDILELIDDPDLLRGFDAAIDAALSKPAWIEYIQKLQRDVFLRMLQTQKWYLRNQANRGIINQDILRKVMKERIQARGVQIYTINRRLSEEEFQKALGRGYIFDPGAEASFKDHGDMTHMFQQDFLYDIIATNSGKTHQEIVDFMGTPNGVKVWNAMFDNLLMINPTAPEFLYPNIIIPTLQ